jgi:hypothetical protein
MSIRNSYTRSPLKNLRKHSYTIVYNGMQVPVHEQNT